MIFATEANLAPIICSGPPPSLTSVILTTINVAFLWLPLVFVAYAIGRRRTGMLFFFALLTVESIAIAAAMYLSPEIFGKS